MITDKQIEAAAEGAYLKYYADAKAKAWIALNDHIKNIWRDVAGAALEAAEAAAWCDDIGQAPMDRRILVELHRSPTLYWIATWCPSWDGSPGVWGIEDDYRFDKDIKRWRHLPQPPKEEMK